MVDTAFWVPPEKRVRLIDPPAGGEIYPDRDVTKPTTLFSGGGGLVSTAADYLRFCQMLLNGGELDGVRFFVDGGDHTRIAFLRDEVGKPTGLVLNPGPWQIRGERIN